MVKEVEDILVKYHLVLAMVLEFAFRSKSDAEKKKDHSHNFYNNKVILLMGKLKLSKNAVWDNHASMIKSFYKGFVSEK